MSGRITKWTDREDNFLRENACDITVRELTAGLVGISPVTRHVEAVRYHCRRIGVQPKNAGRHFWTLEEERILKGNYYELGLEKTAKLLGIPKLVVKRKVAKSTTMIEMERKTPWMSTMMETIEDMGTNIYDLSVKLFKAGELVEIQETDGKMALFVRVRR